MGPDISTKLRWPTRLRLRLMVVGIILSGLSLGGAQAVPPPPQVQTPNVKTLTPAEVEAYRARFSEAVQQATREAHIRAHADAAKLEVLTGAWDKSKEPVIKKAGLDPDALARDLAAFRTETDPLKKQVLGEATQKKWEDAIRRSALAAQLGDFAKTRQRLMGVMPGGTFREGSLGEVAVLATDAPQGSAVTGTAGDTSTTLRAPFPYAVGDGTGRAIAATGEIGSNDWINLLGTSESWAAIGGPMRSAGAYRAAIAVADVSTSWHTMITGTGIGWARARIALHVTLDGRPLCSDWHEFAWLMSNGGGDEGAFGRDAQRRLRCSFTPPADVPPEKRVYLVVVTVSTYADFEGFGGSDAGVYANVSSLSLF